MAVDEALLQTVTTPVLRFYGWRQPSLSFGYFGRFAEVAVEAGQRELVRRWTGGGIVLHGEDFTYSLILPRVDLVALFPPQVIYRQIHGAIQTVLARDSDVALAEQDAPKVSEACFANAVTADVLVRGRKIAGAAQRRTRAGLLHQGSIQFAGLPSSFPDAFAEALCANFAVLELSPQLLRHAQELAEAKYGTSHWLRQR